MKYRKAFPRLLVLLLLTACAAPWSVVNGLECPTNDGDPLFWDVTSNDPFLCLDGGTGLVEYTGYVCAGCTGPECDVEWTSAYTIEADICCGQTPAQCTWDWTTDPNAAEFAGSCGVAATSTSVVSDPLPLTCTVPPPPLYHYADLRNDLDEYIASGLATNDPASFQGPHGGIWTFKSGNYSIATDLVTELNTLQYDPTGLNSTGSGFYDLLGPSYRYFPVVTSSSVQGDSAPPEAIAIHPGEAGATSEWLIIEWEATTAGTYNISGYFQDIGGGNGNENGVELVVLGPYGYKV